MNIGANNAVISKNTLKIKEPDPLELSKSGKLYNSMYKIPNKIQNKSNQYKSNKNNAWNLFIKGKSCPLTIPEGYVYGKQGETDDIQKSDVPIPSLIRKESDEEDKKIESDINDRVDLDQINIEEQKQLLAKYQKIPDAQWQETILDNKGQKTKQQVTYSNKLRINKRNKPKYDKIQKMLGFNLMNNQINNNNIPQDANGDYVLNSNFQNDNYNPPQSINDHNQVLNNDNIQFLKWKDDQSMLYSDIDEKQDGNNQVQNSFQINVVMEEPDDIGKLQYLDYIWLISHREE